MKKSGYDRYLEYQFSRSGNFFNALFEAIGMADSTNTEKLRLGFPEEVDAYLTWTRVGAKEFLAKCTPTHDLMKRLEAGEIAL